MMACSEAMEDDRPASFLFLALARVPPPQAGLVRVSGPAVLAMVPLGQCCQASNQFVPRGLGSS
jgi:hypothetical protein